MLKFRIVIVLFLPMALLVSCSGGDDQEDGEIRITGSGKMVTQDFDLSGFDKVDVSHAFDVDISQGDTFSVVVRVDENVEPYVQVVKEGDTLKIGLKPDNYMITDVEEQAEVSMPELVGLNQSGASHVTLAGLKSTKAFDADLSGASLLEGDMETGDIHLSLSGASHAALSGSGRDVIIGASGASFVDLVGFSVTNADVEANGASAVTVNPSGKLDARARDASQVFYIGDPTLGNIDTDNSSSVERK